MSRAHKYALIQSQMLYWVLVAVVVYLLATKLNLAAGLAVLVPQLFVYGWIVVRIRRESRD